MTSAKERAAAALAAASGDWALACEQLAELVLKLEAESAKRLNARCSYCGEEGEPELIYRHVMGCSERPEANLLRCFGPNGIPTVGGALAEQIQSSARVMVRLVCDARRARAAALEEAAKVVERLHDICIDESCDHARCEHARESVEAIRALKEPGHG